MATALVATVLMIGIQATRFNELEAKFRSENFHLQHELKQLKNYELARLAITEEDRDKVHAISPGRRGIQSRLERAIRVYLPESASYRLVVYRGILPDPSHPRLAKHRLDTVRRHAKARYPEADDSTIETGEFDLFLQLTRVPEAPDDWNLVIEETRAATKGQSSTQSRFRLTVPWLADPMLARMRLGIGPHQVTVEPGQPIQLVSIIKSEEVSKPGENRSTRLPKRPAQGIEFWLEPVP